MQGGFTQRQTIESQGEKWFIFGLVNPSSQHSKRIALFPSLRKEEHSDLVLAAVIPNLPFSILFSRTIQVPDLVRHQHNHSQQSLLRAPIVVLSTITLLAHWFHWEKLALANGPPKLLPVEQFQEFIGKVSLRSPASQEYIMVNQDRASLVFHQWQDRIKSKSAWHTPLALVVTVAATLPTATFKDFSWISAGTLKGMFLTFLIACCGWLVWELRKAWKLRGTSADDFIADLAEGTKQTDYGVPTEKVDRGEIP